MDFNSLLNGLLAEDNNASLKSTRTPFNNLIIWAILLLIFLGCGCNGGYGGCGGNQCCCREKCKRRKRCCCRQSCCRCGCENENGCGCGFLNNNCIFIIAIAILIFCSCKEDRDDRGGCANSLVDLDADGVVTVDEE